MQQSARGQRDQRRAIGEISVAEERVILSKDIDFYNSLVLHAKPWKLVLIRTGNIGSRELTVLLEARLDDIVDALAENTLVEIDRTSLHTAP